MLNNNGGWMRSHKRLIIVLLGLYSQRLAYTSRRRVNDSLVVPLPQSDASLLPVSFPILVHV